QILADLRSGAFYSSEFAKFAKGAMLLLEGKCKEAQPSLQGYSDANGWDSQAIALNGIAGHFGAMPDRAERALSDAIAHRSEKSWLQIRAAARYLQAKYDAAKEDYKEAGAEKEAEPLFARRIPWKGLILWLKADAGVEGTESVTCWKDQSEGK